MSFFALPAVEEQLLSVSLALGPAKFQQVHQFLYDHIGRSDLSGTFGCYFQGFAEAGTSASDRPTEDEFLNGQYYFCTGDPSICFGPKIFPTNPR